MGTLRIMVLGVAALGATCAIAACQSGGESSIRPNPETRVDQRGHELVLIPAGTFTMGIDEEQAADICRADGVDHICAQDLTLSMGDAFPPHQVTVDTDYWMDVYEVTNAQYRECVDAGVCELPDAVSVYSSLNYYTDPAFDNYPVVGVDIERARQFCTQWRGGRLPSEAEWEYAARGNDGRLWPWGVSEETLYRRMNYWRRFGVPDDDVIGGPVEVDSYPEGISPFGIFNMAGNVKEWTDTPYQPYPGARAADLDLQAEGWYIIRGGSYLDEAWISNSVSREKRPLTHSVNVLGFRCVKSGNGS